MKRFVNVNRRISRWLTPDHFAQGDAYHFYNLYGRILLSMPTIARVLDVGAGKAWHFDPRFKKDYGLTLIGLDIDEAEMQNNPSLDEKLVADATQSLEVADGTIDLIMGHAVVEHFSNTETFITSCWRALRPSGMVIFAFPNKYAPFAILNQLLPLFISNFLLKTFVPGSQGVLGFRAFYDRCSYLSFKRLLIRNGFHIEYNYVSFFSSDYFAFFVPFYLLSLAMDLLRYIIGIKQLGSYNLFIASKPAAESDDAGALVEGEPNKPDNAK